MKRNPVLPPMYLGTAIVVIVTLHFLVPAAYVFSMVNWNLRAETSANHDLPVPPLGQWVRYYLGHPHHFLVRMYQITAGPGILFSGQQYLLRPAATQRP